MASRRVQLIALASVVALGAGAYSLVSLLAAQAQGELAQAPLNVETQIPAAFMMAVDDSGSMTFETLFAGDEQGFWGDGCLTGTCPNGFFNGTTLRESGRGSYYHLIQNGIRLDFGGALDTGTNGMRLAIPPLDLFGFARSPAYNKQWFDPAVQYKPWINADGTPWPNAPVTAARSDPRPNGSAGVRGPNPVVTYNFAAVEDRTANYFAFRFQPGMRLPQGTEWYIRGDRHANGCGGLGTNAATRNSWQTVNAVGGHLITDANNLNYNPGAGNNRGGGCEIHIRHFPAVVFLRVGATAPQGFNPARAVTVPNAGGAGVPLIKYELRPENFNSGSDYNAVIQNFANWYTYYGNRNRAMIAAMSQAMSEVNNLRVGYFAINKRSGDWPGMSGGNVTMRDMATATGKSALFSDMFTLPADGGTPTRSATVYMGDQFRRTDANAPVQQACQINAGMLFTDGFTNEGGTFGNAYRSFGDTDSTLPRPLGGNANGNTIADIAYSFYANNLRPDLPTGLVPVREACSNVPVDLRLDCQRNLHMNFYGITLGATGEVYGVNAAATADPYTTFPNWSVTGTTSLQPSNVDDIWHATLNTRGEYVNAQTPADITAAMRRVIGAVGSGASPAGSIALTGARVNAGSLAVSPFYESRNEGTDWYGRMFADKPTLNPTTRAVDFVREWDAAERMPAPNLRRIWYAESDGTVQDFNATNVGALAKLCSNPRPGMSRCSALTLAQIGAPTSPTTIGEAVSYLRGDQSQEVDRAPTGKFRYRTTVLGDIVNSTPQISEPNDDYGYRGLPAPYGTSYGSYLTAKTSRRTMVYAGANDGMLHAFDGRTAAQGGGVESFAYIPNGVLGHMGNLLFPFRSADGNDQKFQHRYYVDGPVSVSDAYFGGGWKTVLVASTGAGARGAFALDLSGVSAPGGNFAASDRLWEINDLSTSLPTAVRDNIGHVLGRAVIVPVRTGSSTGPVKWRAIFGNGYNSVSGKAVLFMVDIDSGPLTASKITMIEAVESGGQVPPGSNGLGNIVVVDRWGPATDGTLTLRVRDGFADTVYAADQKGAIWKFDIRTSSPSNATVPLFTTLRYTAGADAGFRQPITGGLAAAAGPGGGVLLYFGSGSFSFVGDTTDTTSQSLYAVLDRSSALPTTTLTRANLQQQTITVSGTGSRSTSANVPTNAQSGWYLDLPAGERFVGYPRIESGVVFLPTYDPQATASCGSNGKNWLYGLNALTGAAGMSNVRPGSPTATPYGSGTGAVALSTSGTAPVKDVAVLTTPRVAPLGASATAADLNNALAAQCSMVVQVAGAPPLYMPRPCGRQSWRQVQ